MSTSKTHILVFPYPAQGHMLPLLDLTHNLCLHNLSITILITPKNLLYLSSLLSTHPSSITPLILPFPSHPSIPAGIEHVKDLGHDGNLAIINALHDLRDPLFEWFKSHPNPPVAIISDFFLGWTQTLALQLNIRRLTFYSSGAFLVSIDHMLWNEYDKFKPLEEVELTHLPGSHKFKASHLPSFFYLHDKSDPGWEFVRKCMLENTRSWGCVFNSFQALEGVYLDHLKKELCHERIFGVGPLNLACVESSSRGNSGSNSQLNDRVVSWLDRCYDGSVVYVCFGSQKLLNKNQMQALADGLEKSGVRFIWVVKTGTAQEKESGFGVVPEGFEKRVMGRGMVIREWAPQVLILSHKAVGGFLSHCGWNSVLEGIVGGVMILAWPMEADQFVNAKLLVDGISVAVRVCEGAYTVPDSDELGRVMGESMSVGGQVKKRAMELKKKAFEAMADGGSSVKDLASLVQELYKLNSTST